MNFGTATAALGDLEAGTFVGIDMLTDVKLKGGKKNPMQGRVTKLVTGATVMCFANGKSNAYNNMVKRRLIEEGKDAADFELGPRAWGERIKGTPFITHKGNVYLEVIFMNSGKTQYFLDGKPIAPADIEGLEKPREGTQGGLENKVIIRTPQLSSIMAMRVNGQEYR